MKISEAIEKLQAFKEEVGDVHLVMLTDVEDGKFYIDWDRELDLVQIPNDCGCEEHFTTVASFMVPVDPSQLEYPKLRVVEKGDECEQ